MILYALEGVSFSGSILFILCNIFWILEYDTLDLEGWNSLMFLLSINFTSCKSAADLPRCVGGAILFLSV